jgi:hypothetical protein
MILRDTKFFWLLILTLIAPRFAHSQIRNVKPYKSFPKSESLKHSEIQINEVVYPSSIHLVDDVVIMMDKKAEHAVHLFKVSDWSLLANYGTRGNGPTEVQVLKFHGQSVKKDNETYLWFSDFRAYRLKKISLTGMLKDKSTEPVVSHKLLPELAMTYDDIYAISDTDFIGTVEGNIYDFTNDPKAGRFFQFNIKNKKIKWTANFPEQKLQEPKNKLGYVYSSQAIFNNRTIQMASGMRYYDRIDIIDVVKNNVLTVVHEDNTEVQEVDLRDDFRLIPLSTRHYYGSGYSTDRLIYFFYSNKTAQQSSDFNKGLTSDYPNRQLRVFDWEGNPVYHAQLDKPNLGSFFVDEKTWKLYAVDGSPENEDDMIVSYQLPVLSSK